ncbi:MAG TPA: nuclease-related domain-containing protein [Opitutaceae bacterium]|nr:nuclease-related domain-containing protein [Opitutaceae bacterium]
MSETGLYITLAYFALFIFGALGLAIWRIKRRNTRPPLETKLLRGPGETLRKRMAEYDENLLFRLVMAAMVPMVPVLVVGWAIVQFAARAGLPVWVWFGILIVAFVAALVPTVRWVLRDLDRFRAYRLGYFGERVVGEKLNELVGQGYAVFHDVPGQGQKKPFNLDHVAVGPSGVAVVETKTRRKGRARPGYKDHEVTYDGQQLIWPWGEDRHGLAQALWEADWLRSWIFERTGIDTPVKPILALPGWYVHMGPRKPVDVVNHEWVCGAVRGNKERLLDSAQIALIARQLDVLCRDVED